MLRSDTQSFADLVGVTPQPRRGMVQGAGGSHRCLQRAAARAGASSAGLEIGACQQPVETLDRAALGVIRQHGQHVPVGIGELEHAMPAIRIANRRRRQAPALQLGMKRIGVLDHQVE